MKKTITTLLVAAAVLSSCGNKGKESISGAGATFPAPFYNIVFKDYSQTEGGSTITYGGIGSGGGIRSLTDKTVDFGASDVFLSDDEMTKIGAEVIHVPTVLGGVVLAYNLPEVKDLNLNADVITAIYTGAITKWNDEKIKSINPDATLPDRSIIPVYRSDGSGTTSVFSEYLSKVNSEWKDKIGKGKALNFPQGIAAKGNPGVAGIIVETAGSVGYIGSEYALALNIPTAAVENSSGNYVKADEKSISASANIEIPADTRTVITNSDNPEAYPISTFTWIIVYKEQNYNGRSLEKAQALKNLLRYVLSDEGQKVAVKTSYAPLTGKSLEITRTALEGLTYNGEIIE